MITLEQVIHYQLTNSVEATWADGGTVVRCHSYSDAQMADLRADLGADASKYAAMIALVESRIVPADSPVIIPAVVSLFQGCSALQAGGYLDPVEAYMAGPATAVEKLAWRTITEIRRASPLTAKLALMLGLTEQQVDELFILAATIEA